MNMFADHPLPFAETFLMQANYISWIIQTLKVWLVFWQTPSTKSKEKDIVGERTKSVSWIICAFIYFEHMNDWNDKFHFYVKRWKPLRKSNSPSIYIFFFKWKVWKQRKIKKQKKKLFQNFVPQETSGAWRTCNMPLKIISPNVCSVTEWKNIKRGSSSILLLFSRSDFTCSVPLFLFFCRFFYGAVKSVSLFCFDVFKPAKPLQLKYNPVLQCKAVLHAFFLIRLFSLLSLAHSPSLSFSLSRWQLAPSLPQSSRTHECLPCAAYIVHVFSPNARKSGVRLSLIG